MSEVEVVEGRRWLLSSSLTPLCLSHCLAGRSSLPPVLAHTGLQRRYYITQLRPERPDSCWPGLRSPSTSWWAQSRVL